MTGSRWSWVAVAMGLVLGALAVLGGTGLSVPLGALVMIISIGLALGELRRRRKPAGDPAPGPIPELSPLERIGPALFVATAAVIVLAALIYTLLQLGYL